MLIAAIILFLSGGSSIMSYKKGVKEVIHEDSRKEEILEIFKDIQKLGKKHKQELKSIDKELKAINKSPSGHDQAFKSLQEEAQTTFRTNLEKNIEYREKIHSLLREDEWNKIFNSSTNR